ncbi:hypothetical protein T459_00654 [Capsicum annuum]|uniref:NOSIC domain-containing protein n=1 Tax=Capsicum annuum TaxID=4072 RepID=A0A2G3AEW1_CAPAN|nr:hypothetical protein T459_00654 [Capsicum annuum]
MPQKVEDALERESDVMDKGVVLEDDPEYQLIVDCNALSVDIENEIVIIHNFIRDKYRLKFPKLESLVHHPVDYAQVVKKIRNEMDLTLVELEGLLPSAIIMVVSVTASTTSGKPLPEDVLQKTVEACDRALALDSAKKKPKPLPVPDSEPKKKRGGRRLRKMKERYAITDMRKLANRMQFGIPEESSLGDGLVEGYGMLGKAGSGKLRVSVGQSKLAAKVAKKFKEKSYGSSGATSGLTSSLAFTPVQVDGNKIVYNHVSIDVLDLREPVILYCIVACPNDFNCPFLYAGHLKRVQYKTGGPTSETNELGGLPLTSETNELGGPDSDKEMDLEPNSTSKASSRCEDYPTPYKQTPPHAQAQLALACGPGAQNGDGPGSDTMIKKMDLVPNSTSKASS